MILVYFHYSGCLYQKLKPSERMILNCCRFNQLLETLFLTDLVIDKMFEVV